MLILIYKLAYNLLIFPVIFVLWHFFAVFQPKIRQGLLGRYRTAGQIRRFKNELPDAVSRVFLFHCASLGEFEHIRPVLSGLREVEPESRAVLMFFSPSGYDNYHPADGVDLVVYAPFDSWLSVKRLFNTLKPVALVVAKYDVWPNQAFVAKASGVPVIILNATMHSGSARMGTMAKRLVRPIYRMVSQALAISAADAVHYAQIMPAERVSVVGDTKFDQAIIRRELAEKHPLLPLTVCKQHLLLVAGSTWPEDEEQLIPALKAVISGHPEFRAVICPHEPTPVHLQGIVSALSNIPFCYLSKIADYDNQPLILVDSIGVLAGLYSQADIAYVGGSFRQNIHNVLEPAANGIPVIFGPVHQNSIEAQDLLAAGGAVAVDSAETIRNVLLTWLDDDQTRQQTGARSLDVVNAHRGATTKMIHIIRDLS